MLSLHPRPTHQLSNQRPPLTQEQVKGPYNRVEENPNHKKPMALLRKGQDGCWEGKLPTALWNQSQTDETVRRRPLEW